MNTRSAAARDADEFFDFARYGLMLAEQIGDDVTRDNLLKLIRLVGGLTGCQAVNGRAGLMRELIYISLLAGFASGLLPLSTAVYLLFSLPPLPLSRPMLPSGRRANRANSLQQSALPGAAFGRWLEAETPGAL